MKGELRTVVFVLAVIFAFATTALSQKHDEIKSLPDTATLAESQKWFTETFVKYASYKTRATTVDFSNAKFDGCTFSFTQVRKSGSVSTAVMGATRTVNSVKEEISFDNSLIAPDGITVTDHVYPEIQTLELKLTNDARIVEIVVKREASDAMKAAIMQIRRLCTAKN